MTLSDPDDPEEATSPFHSLCQIVYMYSHVCNIILNHYCFKIYQNTNFCQWSRICWI